MERKPNRSLVDLATSAELRAAVERALERQAAEPGGGAFGQELRESTVAAMRAAGIRPALIYAHERTGLLVTSEHRQLVSASDLDEWEDAIAEYEELHPGARD